MCPGNPPQLKGAEAWCQIIHGLVRGVASSANVYAYVLGIGIALNKEDYATLSPKLNFTDDGAYLPTAIGYVLISDTGEDVMPGEILVRLSGAP